MPLSPDAQAVFDSLAAAGNQSVAEVGIEAVRGRLAAWNLMGDAPDVPTEDVDVQGVRVRVYRPDDAVGTLVWFHGGGWACGSLEEHDAFCRRFALAAQVTVANVEYRMAPEHPFPAGLDDCWTATRWAAATLPAPVAVGGDSAGGNLAAAVTLRARDAGGPTLAFQLLVYPAVDAEMSYPSIQENGTGYFLSAENTDWFWDHYTAGHDRRDPLVSPLYAADHAGLPPAYIVTAEYDPLRDEGEAYGLLLEKAGVPTVVRRWDGQMHAFFTVGGVYAATEPAVQEAAATLRAALRKD
jgi:acetyl esterase